MPEIASGLKTAYFTVSNEIMSEDFSMKQSINDMTRQGSRIVTNALKQGGKELSKTSSLTYLGNTIKQEISSVSETALQTSGTYITELLYKDLFKMFDKDGSGYISYSEFCDLCRYMGLYLSEERMLKLFSQADTNQNNYIEIWEFQTAMLLINHQIVIQTLRKLGVTTGDLILFGVLTVIYLLLVLTFIFLGIFAFSRAEGFNAVVNSILPLAAGFAAGARRLDMKEKIEQAKSFIRDLISKFRRMA